MNSAPETRSPSPRFAVTMTVRNNAGSIERSIETIVRQVEGHGELAVVDARSTDGTTGILERMAEGRSWFRVRVEESNRGQGRNLAVGLTTAPIVLTHIDGDNLYADAVLERVVDILYARTDLDLLMVIGDGDRDPSSSRFYAWRRPAFERIGGYAETQFLEDLGTLLKALRAPLRIDRVRVPRVAEDLKPRRPRQAPSVGPWRRSNHVYRAARKFRILGFRYGEYVRFLWLTRRTPARFIAGTVVGAAAYLRGAMTHDRLDFLTDEDDDAAGVRAIAAERARRQGR